MQWYPLPVKCHTPIALSEANAGGKWYLAEPTQVGYAQGGRRSDGDHARKPCIGATEAGLDGDATPAPQLCGTESLARGKRTLIPGGSGGLHSCSTLSGSAVIAASRTAIMFERGSSVPAINSPASGSPASAQ